MAVPAVCFSPGIRECIAKTSSGQSEGILSFQSGKYWSPRINLDADTVFVYGIGNKLPARLNSWRSHGYRTDVMTGIAWGQYANYLEGRFDGVNHEDEAQVDRFGNMVSHGSGGNQHRASGHPHGQKQQDRGNVIYYMVPTLSYVRFITVGIKKALDAGADAICLEEPEFWVRSGYSGAFKREWQAYYGEAWRPPDSSPDAQYRASKLKYYLYRRAITKVFDFVYSYSRKKGHWIPCYVASHSLPNYSNWRIVSPESSLERVTKCDGYIAQVWTGTARTPNVYDGKRQERTFETAFLEYGAMLNLSRVSGRTISLLNDPVEDNPNHSWADYRANWESTMTATLFHPQAWRYEIMPWPTRVFTHKYPVSQVREMVQGGMVHSLESGGGYPARTRVDLAQPNTKRSLIPQDYAVELQVVIEALKRMRQPQDSIRWEQCGTQGTGILISDTMMFQRGDPYPSDANLGSFYGLALPLVMKGLPLAPVQMEYAATEYYLNPYRLLVLTYEGQKPPTADFHKALAKWVRRGGAVVLIDNGQDPYNSVREWWNTPPYSYAEPRQHLFKELGLDPHAKGLHRIGKGVIIWDAQSPAALSYEAEGSRRVTQICKTAAEAVGLSWQESRTLVLRRGPYVIGAGLDTPSAHSAPQPLHGRYINLFNADLPVVKEVAIKPRQRFLLLDLDAYGKNEPRVLAASCRISGEAHNHNSLRFWAAGIIGTQAVVCLELPRAPKSALVAGHPLHLKPSDYRDGTLRIRFLNSGQSVTGEVVF